MLLTRLRNTEIALLFQTQVLVSVRYTNRLLYLDDKEASEFAYKLIEYALLREEVRETENWNLWR